MYPLFRLALASAFMMLIACTFLSAQSDLSLKLLVANESAPIYKNVTYTVTLKNSGPDTAFNVLVKAPQQYLSASFGLVLASSDASKGNWNLITNVWELSTLAPSDSAVLELVLFTMSETRPPFFAQVTSSDTPDSDSSPNNGNVQLGAREDDEVLHTLTPPAACAFDVQFLEDTCILTPQTSIYGFKMLVTPADPTVQLVEVATNPYFLQSFVVEANEIYVPGLSDYIYLSENQNVTYYLRAFGTVGCKDSTTLLYPSSCTTTEPPPPSDCIFPSWFPAVYCINDGQNIVIPIDLGPSAFGTLGLNFLDKYELLIDDEVIGSGIVENPAYFGLNGVPIATSSDIVNIQIRRISDNRCIGQATIRPSDYCNEINQGYCYQVGIYPWEEWIKRVQMDNLDNTSGKSQFSNFTFGNALDQNSAFLIAGDSVPFTVEIGYNWITYNDFVSIWLDSDRNGTFSDSELIYSGAVPSVPFGPIAQATLTGKAFIPEEAINGASTMKVVLQRGAPATVCGTVPYGEVELYPVRIGGGNNSGDGCSSLTLDILGVECSDNGTPGIAADDVYFIDYIVNLPGREGERAYVGGFWIDNGIYSSPVLNSSTQYQGFVGEPARYGPVSMTQFPTLNFSAQGWLCSSGFITVNAPTNTCSDNPSEPTSDCAATSNFPWEEWISKIKIGNFVKNSGKAEYSDFTNETIPLQMGNNPITIRSTFSYLTYDEYCRIWIDFDHNGVLESSEIAFSGIISRPQNGVPFKEISGQINVPASAMAGEALMRVRMSRYDYAEPCGLQSYGEVEDYTINLAVGRPKLQSTKPHEPVQISEARVFPNPAGQRVYIQFAQAEAVSIRLTDQFGQVILIKECAKTNQFEELDLSQVANGHYYLHLVRENARPEVQKLIVARDY